MTASTDYMSFHARSLNERDAFWAEQANLIEWETPFSQVLDYSKPPFARWFVGGRTSLCHNALDRHLAKRAGQPALIWVSSEVDSERVFTYGELFNEVNRMAASLQSLGVGRGDRVLIYLPMVPEALFAMLACARLGAIHSVVFGGFASVNLASRIDDAQPKVVVSADAGSRNGKVVPYKPLLDEGIALASYKPDKVLLINRGLAPMYTIAGRDVDYATLREAYRDAEVPCAWLESSEPSYILYTSGTTGKPKGVQRDTGGYAVALAASIKHIFCGAPGDTMFGASDIGWVVGHSYTVYGPLLAGMATVMYEGTPIHPDAGIWWRIVDKYRVTHLFAAPTAIRVLKKQDSAYLTRSDLSSLKLLFLAGEPLDQSTARWISENIGKPVVDNYWQTETGWPVLGMARGVEVLPSKPGSPGLPMYGYDVKLVNEATGEDCGPNEKGLLAINGPLPPGTLNTVWGDDTRFVETYWQAVPGRMLYSTFDWGVRDDDGHYFILGRTDDVINVAGHRLGSREIEESIASHPAVAEVAVVGVKDPLKGQVAVAFAVLRHPEIIETIEARRTLEGEVMMVVDRQLGAVARPARVYFVSLLPKTRSGKLLRRVIQAICEGREAADLMVLEDPAALTQVREAARSEVGIDGP